MDELTMITKQDSFYGEPYGNIWIDSINGLLDIAHKHIKQGECEEARRITSGVAKILDEAYED